MKKEFANAGLDVEESIKLWERNQDPTRKEMAQGNSPKEGTRVTGTMKGPTRKQASDKAPVDDSAASVAAAPKRRESRSPKQTAPARQKNVEQAKRQGGGVGDGPKGRRTKKATDKAPADDTAASVAAAAPKAKRQNKATDKARAGVVHKAKRQCHGGGVGDAPKGWRIRDRKATDRDKAPDADIEASDVVAALKAKRPKKTTDNARVRQTPRRRAATIALGEHDGPINISSSDKDDAEEEHPTLKQAPAAQNDDDGEELENDELEQLGACGNDDHESDEEESDEEESQEASQHLVDPFPEDDREEEEERETDRAKDGTEEAASENAEADDREQPKFGVRDRVLGFFATQIKGDVVLFPGQVINAERPNNECGFWTYSVMFQDETCMKCYWRSNDDLNFEDVESVSTQNGHALHPDKSKTFICEYNTTLLNSEVLKEYDPNLRSDLEKLNAKVDRALAKRRRV